LVGSNGFLDEGFQDCVMEATIQWEEGASGIRVGSPVGDEQLEGALLHARTPRVKCDEHGIHQVALPWAEPRSRFTAMFERFAIDVLRETSVAGATRILRISWDEAFGIMGRAVERGLARREDVPVEYVGIDEKSIRKGHRYLTIATDLQRGAVLWLGENRKAETPTDFGSRGPLSAAPRSRRSRWTCGSRTSSRRLRTCPMAPRRSCTIASTSCSTPTVPWTRFVALSISP
jgi:hypothetical protein